MPPVCGPKIPPGLPLTASPELSRHDAAALDRQIQVAASIRCVATAGATIQPEHLEDARPNVTTLSEATADYLAKQHADRLSRADAGYLSLEGKFAVRPFL